MLKKFFILCNVCLILNGCIGFVNTRSLFEEKEWKKAKIILEAKPTRFYTSKQNHQMFVVPFNISDEQTEIYFLHNQIKYPEKSSGFFLIIPTMSGYFPLETILSTEDNLGIKDLDLFLYSQINQDQKYQNALKKLTLRLKLSNPIYQKNLDKLKLLFQNYEVHYNPASIDIYFEAKTIYEFDHSNLETVQSNLGKNFFKIELDSQRKKTYYQPLALRICCAPFTIVLDIITFPIQALVYCLIPRG